MKCFYIKNFFKYIVLIILNKGENMFVYLKELISYISFSFFLFIYI